MHSHTLGAAAFFLILVSSAALSAPILGSGPEEAIKLFREADAKCRYAHCRHHGRYAFGTFKGKTNVLYFTWEQAQPLSLYDSQKLAGDVIPKDAQKIRTIMKQDGSVAEVFKSEELVRQFGTDPSVWIGAKPGTFVVFHSNSLRKTIISVGDFQ
ncbi:hypothetical protein [Noviherbaspirillum aerium]|uniref:hypothetical protein n=1 Tax=Noviherbaspirillum aerium TaxID=2588497 RepID=UPI00124C1F35|nr:hypothetical protein [Noviherbaspirillum aerium]